MPWRLAVDPYACWLSEIMLQQTTYEQALPYYERFRRRFPSVVALAAADEQDVLKAWEGLGYYARARNLAKAAKAVVRDGWPTTREGWLALPGVGPYTAAALASVLNGVRVPVVDGNVVRVFTRYWHLAGEFKDTKARESLGKRLVGHMTANLSPGDFNQAMMELGALVCTPRSPRCEACPLAPTCAAYASADAASWPKRVKRAPVPVRKRTFLVVGDGAGRVLLVRNASGGLLKGLWELPSAEAAADYAQTFSHFKLEAQVWHAGANPPPQFADPKSVPLTTAARRILTTAGLLSEIPDP